MGRLVNKGKFASLPRSRFGSQRTRSILRKKVKSLREKIKSLRFKW